MSDQVWLTLNTVPNGSGVQIGVDRDEAMALDRKGFAKLYRRTCCGARRREANEWADKQIAERAAAGRLSAVGEET